MPEKSEFIILKREDGRFDSWADLGRTYAKDADEAFVRQVCPFNGLDLPSLNQKLGEYLVLSLDGMAHRSVTIDQHDLTVFSEAEMDKDGLGGLTERNTERVRRVVNHV